MNTRQSRQWLGGILLAAALPSAAAAAQPRPTVPAPILQSRDEALEHDAGEFARRYGLTAEEALRRLRFQEASVAQTDALRAEFKDRLAGLYISHQPAYRIVVLLTGATPIADRVIQAGGTSVTVTFQTGARATHDQLLTAIDQRQLQIRGLLGSASQGIGLDPKTGEIVVLAKEADLPEDEIADKRLLLSAMTGVPVRIDLINREARDSAVEGGSLVVGVDPSDGHRRACTTGFVVADATRTGIITAAHCPDELTYFGPDGAQVPLGFVGEWGALTQDVQVHVSSAPQKAEFFVDKERTLSRPLVERRSRASTRVGDIVCHRGESSGYSCATVELVDFAPPVGLCGGVCKPVWVTVAGPSCRGGDSGGPIFAGTTAFGIVKGSSYKSSGECNFYFYMSLDFLPDGWSLLMHQ